MKNIIIFSSILIYLALKPHSSASQDSIVKPWTFINLTGERMKPGYPFYIPDSQNKFPWLPVSGGIVFGGLITYFLISNDKNPNTCSFEASFETHNSNCNLPNGSISIQLTPPGQYSYIWSNGHSSAELQNLAAGNYVVTVTETTSMCSKIFTSSLQNIPTNIQIQLIPQSADCGMENGKISAIIQPSGIYSFQWSNGQTGPSIENLQPGLYQLTVSAGGSCTQIASTTVAQNPPAFQISLQKTPEFCNQANGTATAFVSPSGNYSYIWSNGATSSTANGFKAGRQQLTVTQTGTGCALPFDFQIESKNAEHLIFIESKAATCGIPDGTAFLQVEPPGTYKIKWSNTANTNSVDNLSAGMYSVTVTDVNNCSVEGSVNIDESPAKYITDHFTSSGNCIGDFTNIRLVLESPSQGPFNISAIGPNGNFQIAVPKTSADLNNYFRIVPGNWLITVRDSNLKPACFEELSLVVPDSSDFITNSDSFKTSINKAVSGNVLLNDTGISLQIISFIPPPSEDFSIQNNGSFTFTPKKDSTGIFSFTYKIQDTCKTIKDQIAIIYVDSVGCDFTVKFNSTSAHCGLADGTLSVVVDSPGTYSYLWNTGNSGATLTNVRKGNYTVSITDELKKCELIFNNGLNELPAEYIRNIKITQPGCQIPGEIRMEVFTPGNGPMKMILNHPGGNGIYTIQKGTLNISSYAPLVPGAYSISIYDESADLDCLQEITATIEASTAIEIILEGVIPPSSPSASDGTALVLASVSGVLPYVVLLNNLPYITAFDHFIEIGGLSAGSYMIQLRDANNCLSNKLTVVIPPRLFIWSLGLQAIINLNQTHQTENTGKSQVRNFWRSGFQLSAQYRVSGQLIESHLYYASNGHQNYIDLEQVFTVKQFKYQDIRTCLQAGFGFHYHQETKLQNKFLTQLRSEYSINANSQIFGTIKLQNIEEQTILFQFGIDFRNPFNFSKLKMVK